MSNIESLYPHNKKVFLEAMENLKTHKKLGIIQATGTGKGKLASCFVEHVLKRKPNAKILILAPLHTILDNYRDNFGLTDSEVFFNTYKMLLSFDKTYLHNLGLTYDLIIVDEFHRLGAEKWGPAVKTIFDGVDSPKSTCRVIGFTATPIRYLDNARDMSDELFGGNVLQGLNLEDAICEGILPCFVYNACYFSTEDKLALVEKKLASNDYKIVDDTIRNDLMVKVKELRMLYHNKLKIENILRETTKDLGATQKWIIFCRDKDSLDEIREICKTWFVSVPSLYIIHSDKYRSDNRRILKEFRESKSGVNVLLCIDMLNEGVHIKDIDGIIMLRKTDSPIIFLQQLGRALEAGKTTQPLIYDLVGNYKDLKVENGDGLVGNTISIVKGIADKVKKLNKTNYVIVHNYTEDLDNFLEELSLVTNGAWSEKEILIVKEYYSLGGPKLCVEKGLNRTERAIISYAQRIGLKMYSSFSLEEEELLRKHYVEGGSQLCIEKGLNRSPQAIRDMAHKLGILYSGRNFTPEQETIIRKYYNIGGASLCKEKGVAKSLQSIRTYATKLGLTYDGNSWTPEEIEIVKKYYPSGGCSLCKQHGLKRSSPAIQRYATLLGLSYIFGNWSPFEVEIVKKYYHIGGASLCIEKGISNRSKNAIKAFAHKNGFALSKDSMLWKEDEDAIIRRYYQIGGASLCIEKGLIDRNKTAIQKRASVLGINKLSGRWTVDEDNMLKEYYPVGGAALCIENGLSNHSFKAIQKRANDLGVKIIYNK